MQKQPAPAKRSKFAGFQSEIRNLSALPIRIDYQATLSPYSMRPKGDDWLFDPSTSQELQDFANAFAKAGSEEGSKEGKMQPGCTPGQVRLLD